jgi:hypothetical protein
MIGPQADRSKTNSRGRTILLFISIPRGEFVAFETIVAGFVPAYRADVVASLAVSGYPSLLMGLAGREAGGIEGNSPFAGRQHWQEEECRKDPFHVHHPLMVAGKGQRDVDSIPPRAYTAKNYHFAAEMKVMIAGFP